MTTGKLTRYMSLAFERVLTLYFVGLMLVISMFYTRTEIGERIGW